MTVETAKRVRYEASERLDLIDKAVEDVLLLQGLGQVDVHTRLGDADGRVFFGFQTSLVVGPNPGAFALTATNCAAVDRKGTSVVVPASSVASVPSVVLVSNQINYIHAYASEIDADPAARRRWVGSGEASATINTRYERVVRLHRKLTAYGTPAFGGFDQEANIGGVTYTLIPLYAIAVDPSDDITDVADFRPLYAPGIEGAGGNRYNVLGGPRSDFPFEFWGSDPPTLNVVNTRAAIVAIVDRIKQLKGTTTWWESSAKTLADVANDRRTGVELLGVKDGVNTTFTLPETFTLGSETLYWNGLRQERGASKDYTAQESGGPGTGYDTIAMAIAPVSGESLVCDYSVA